MDSPTADPFIGKTVAHYDVLAKLGGGGMGVVYSARDTKLGRRVALKFLPPQWSHDEGAKARFIREAQAASATDHPNICTIHDIASAPDGQLFIVMAHYDGQTLKQRLEEGPLPVDTAIDLGAQIAEGLAKAHGQGVVHRDVKPGNLILTEHGVKILDFGLAKFADSLQLTLAGSTLGTVAYMSPEQTRGEDADARSDVWSAGVVLYEMLTGALPFKGAYAEAIGHAIRHDTPPPLKSATLDIPDGVAAIVMRALAKDPGERIQSARELARDLRLLQGRTIPLDLRTMPLSVAGGLALPPPRRRRMRTLLATAAVLMVALVGTGAWLLTPVERTRIVVAPLGNQTGYSELDPFRLALTSELVTELTESESTNVVPYDRLLQLLRRYREPGQDVSSRDAVQALTANSGAAIVVVPTLLYEGGAWRARAEFRNAESATNTATFDTAPVTSSLIKDTAYGLMPALVAGIDEHFLETGSRRRRWATAIRRLVGLSGPVPARSMRNLDAATAFAAGIDAYDRLEYPAAFTAFAAAGAADPDSAIAAAWQSRAAQLMRRDNDARATAAQALRLVTERTPTTDRTFVDAVAAESRREYATAEAHYRALTERLPDRASWLIELGAFQDRRGQTAVAIETYRRALAIDSRLVRPHLELCRLYSPSRLNEPVNAREQGQLALTQYRTLGNQDGEAQALLCLADTLRVGGATERIEAARSAEEARTIFERRNAAYQLPRAHYYLAIVAGMQGRLAESITRGETALALATQASNIVLEAQVLLNLGVTTSYLGQNAKALDYYRRSATALEAIGDELRAAQNQANAAAIVAEYGGSLDEARRDVLNALGVFRKLGDKDFEVFSMQVSAAFDRYGGRNADAEAQLNRALAIARERNLTEKISSIEIDLAASKLELGDYTAARTFLADAVGDGSGPNSLRARIRLAQTEIRLGNFDTAREQLARAEADLSQRDNVSLAPLLNLVAGELAYEAGAGGDARQRFASAAAAATDDLPEPSSIEARAYVGLLDGLNHQADRGRAEVHDSLTHALRMGRTSLEARCRIFLARIDLAQGRPADALASLTAGSLGGDGTGLSPELQAQAQFWRSEALRSRNQIAAASAANINARQILERLRGSLPAGDRDRFSSRREIRTITNPV